MSAVALQRAAAAASEEAEAIDAQLREIEEHERMWSPSALKARRDALIQQHLEKSAEAERAKAQLTEALELATADMEAAYQTEIEAKRLFVESAELVAALRPKYESLWTQTLAAGVEVPPRVEPLAVREQNDYALKTVHQRYLAVRGGS